MVDALAEVPVRWKHGDKRLQTVTSELNCNEMSQTVTNSNTLQQTATNCNKLELRVTNCIGFNTR